MTPQALVVVADDIVVDPLEALAPPLGTSEATSPLHTLVVGDEHSGFATLEDVERRYILRVVEACHWNKSKAARILGIGRKTLYRRLESFGIEVESPDP